MPKEIIAETQLNIIDRVVERFLNDEENTILMIRGAWGCGKTHAWKNRWFDEEKRKTSTHRNYAYVSLFGLNTIDEIKNHIVSEVSSTNQKYIKKKIDQAGKLCAGIARAAGNTAQKGLGELANNIATTAILNNLIICFDDLERKGDNMRIKDIFGLASWLNEEKNCRIVFLCNDDAFDNKTNKNYEKHHEKVIDVNIKFAPTSEEACEIASENFTAKDELLKQLIIQEIIKHNITNIRVINKIIHFYKELVSIFEEHDFHKTTRNYIIEFLVLFARCHLIKDDPEYPSSSELMDKDFLNMLLQLTWTKKEGEFNDKDLILMKKGEHLGLRHDVVDSDYVIEALVSNGYFETIEPLITYNDNIEREERKNQCTIKGREVWQIFHNRFDVSEEESDAETISSRIIEFIDDYHDIIDIENNFNSYIWLLRITGTSEPEITSCIQKVIASHTVEALLNLHFNFKMPEPKLLNAIDQKIKNSAAEVELEALIDKIVSNQKRLSDKERNLLHNITADMIFDYLMQKDMPGSWLEEAITWLRAETNTRIAVNEALIRIRDLSHLNLERLRNKKNRVALSDIIEDETEPA